MKKQMMILTAMSSLLLFCSGCIIWSLNPWLADETQVSEPDLSGIWQDAKSHTTAFFTTNSTGFHVLLVNKGRDTSRYSATLHNVAGSLLLDAAPATNDDQANILLRPTHMLFKVAVTTSSLTLYPVSLDDFPARAEAANLGLMPGGSNRDGYTLGGATENIALFVQAQLATGDFFSATPLYTFQKIVPP